MLSYITRIATSALIVFSMFLGMSYLIINKTEINAERNTGFMDESKNSLTTEIYFAYDKTPINSDNTFRFIGEISPYYNMTPICMCCGDYFDKNYVISKITSQYSMPEINITRNELTQSLTNPIHSLL